MRSNNNIILLEAYNDRDLKLANYSRFNVFLKLYCIRYYLLRTLFILLYEVLLS